MKNRQKSETYIMILLLTMSLVAVAPIINSENTTGVSMDDVDVPEGGSDWGLLTVNDVSNLGSCDVTLSWNPNVVSVTDVDSSDFDSMDYYVDDVAGVLSVSAFSYDAMNGDFTIAKVTFEPASGASVGDECDLEITDSLLLTADPIPSDITHISMDGTAQIYAAGYPVLSMNDVDVPEGGSDWGLLTVNDVSNLGSCDVALSWNPNVVSVTDVDSSDFDSMGYYVDDVAGVLSVSAFSYDAMNGDFTIAKVTFEPASGASVGDECDLEITDSLLLTADPIPSDITHISMDGTAQIYAAGYPVLSMDDVDVPEGGSDWGLLTVNDVSNLGSCDVTLSWNPNVVSVTDVDSSDFDSMDYYVDDVAGVLSVSAFSYDAMNGDFTIAKVTFEPASGASVGDECDLEITDSLLLTADPIPSDITHISMDGTAQIYAAGYPVLSMNDVDVPEGGSDWGLLAVNDVSNLGSCDVALSWNPNVVSVTDVDSSDFDSMGYYVDDVAGVLSVSAFSYDAMNGDFTIAKVTFEPASGASVGDECDLEITDSLLLTADPIPSDITHISMDGVAHITKTSSDDGRTGGDDGTSTITNNPPIADASASQTSGFVGESIDFDGSLSTDSDGTITSYAWDFDDGATGGGKTTTHAYSSSGTYQVILTVTDNDDATDEDTVDVVIAIGNNPSTKPTVNGPTTGNKNTEYDYTAVSTDADDDTIQYTFNWDDGSANTVTDFLSSGTTTTQTHSWTAPGIYEISVKAYDNETESATTKLTVLIDTHWVKDIGYLIDDDSDGTYDTFYSNATKEQTDVEKQDDGTYLIDNDEDDDWDYIYDVGTDTLTEYNEPTTDDYTLLIILVLVIILILIIIGYLLKRNKDKKVVQKKTTEKKQTKKKTGKSKK